PDTRHGLLRYLADFLGLLPDRQYRAAAEFYREKAGLRQFSDVATYLLPDTTEPAYLTAFDERLARRAARFIPRTEVLQLVLKVRNPRAAVGIVEELQPRPGIEDLLQAYEPVLRFEELPRLTALLRSLGYDSAAITNTPIPNDLRWRRRMIRGFITSNLSVLSEDSIAQCPAPSDAAWTTALEEVRDFDSGARRTALDLAHIWRHLQPFHANLRMGSPAVLFLLTACRSDE